ncbi:unnamed protein product [Lathyrus oleraceus]
MAMGIDIAEVYVLRKMHKEKMMKNKEEEVKRPKTSECFFWFSKKLRRTTQIEDIKD